MSGLPGLQIEFELERDDDDCDKDTAVGTVSDDHRHLTLSSATQWVCSCDHRGPELKS